MKNKEVKLMRLARCKMPMDIQFFADGGEEAGNADGDGGGSRDAGGTDEKSKEDGKGEMSFDDFLKGDGNQAEFDRRVQKAVSKAVSNAQEKWKVLTDDKVSEAEKLAKMTAAEKQQYLDQKRQKELDDREAAINKRELMATAKNTLADKKLPQVLAEILVYTDADACNESIARVEEAFNAAVEAAVESRLKGGDPMKKGTPPDSEAELQKKVMAAMMGGI